MTTTNDQELQALASDLSNWVPIKEAHSQYPQFSITQFKHLIWQRERHAGLSRCYSQIGKKGYLNIKLFGLWMAGQLPEQKTTQRMNNHTS